MADRPTSSSNTSVRNPRLQELLQLGGKMPPQVTDLEEAVLGAIMLEKNALPKVMDVLSPEAFYDDRHREVYQAIMELFQDSAAIDLLTVTDRLRKRGSLDVVGGASFVVGLADRVQSSAHIEFHARVIMEAFIKRSLIAVASEIHKDAYDEALDAFELMDTAQSKLFEISEKNVARNFAQIHEVMRAAIEQLEERRHNQDGLIGVPSGFTALDRITGGWQNSDLIIIAARPAMGKTAFVLSALRNAAVDHQRPVAMFSLEMGNVQLVNRLMSSEAQLPASKIQKGQLADYEWEQLSYKTRALTQAPIFIDDTPGLSVRELRAKCMKLKNAHKIELVIVDYLQLMQGDPQRNKGGNREQEIAYISRSLKVLAKELEVPVIALSQLSRAVEARDGRRPQLSDLRESGSIEQDADQVMFLYRPEYYGLTEDENGNPTKGVAEVIISKNRHGSIENVPLKFIQEYTRFTDLDGFSSADAGQRFPDTGLPGEFDDAVTIPSKLNRRDDDTPPESGGEAPF